MVLICCFVCITLIAEILFGVTFKPLRQIIILRVFCVSGADGLVKLWLVRTNECTKTFDEHEDKVWTLAVNKKEDRLITGSADSRIFIWEVRNQCCLSYLFDPLFEIIL